ncbi:MAG: hypothetical protein ACYCTE_03860 [Acidimicrobiales bacterium]
MTADRHGTTGAYSRGCRCDACRGAIAAYRRRQRLTTTSPVPARRSTRAVVRALSEPVAEPVEREPWRPRPSPLPRPLPSPRSRVAIGEPVRLASLGCGHDVTVPVERPAAWHGDVWCPTCSEPAPYRSLRGATADDLPRGTRAGRYVVVEPGQ